MCNARWSLSATETVIFASAALPTNHLDSIHSKGWVFVWSYDFP